MAQRMGGRRGSGFTILCLALVLSGCSQKVWYHPEKTQAQANADLKACKNEAAIHTTALDQGSPFMYAIKLGECMTHEGYYSMAPEMIGTP